MTFFDENSSINRQGKAFLSLKCDELGFVYRVKESEDVGIDGEIEIPKCSVPHSDGQDF